MPLFLDDNRKVYISIDIFKILIYILELCGFPSSLKTRFLRYGRQKGTIDIEPRNVCRTGRACKSQFYDNAGADCQHIEEMCPVCC